MRIQPMIPLAPRDGVDAEKIQASLSLDYQRMLQGATEWLRMGGNRSWT